MIEFCALFHDSALKTFYYASKNKNHLFATGFEPTGFGVPNENALSTSVNFCSSLFLDLWNSHYYSFAYIEYYLICLIFKTLSVIKVTMYLCSEEFYWGKTITSIKPRENYACPEKKDDGHLVTSIRFAFQMLTMTWIILKVFPLQNRSCAVT